MKLHKLMFKGVLLLGWLFVTSTAQHLLPQPPAPQRMAAAVAAVENTHRSANVIQNLRI